MITKGLKNLAKELGCVVVLLTQLNRELEKRVNKRPLPSDSTQDRLSRTATTGLASTGKVLSMTACRREKPS
jgi:hypothetical protein